MDTPTQNQFRLGKPKAGGRSYYSRRDRHQRWKGKIVKCVDGHVWEDCKCPAEVIDKQQTRRTLVGVFIAIMSAVILLAMLDCVDSELF